MIGYVDFYDEDKHFGFILDENNEKRFFHISYVIGRIQPKKGAKVKFKPCKSDKGLKADRIEILNKSSRLTLESNSYLLDLIKEISDWKLEAKFEDIERYFYRVDEIDDIINGKISIIKGRKGTGKSAISEYLYQLKQHNIFSQKLTFKNFPFNELYELTDDKYTYPNQYITLWKYLIYSAIVKLMIKNESIDGAVREKFSKVFLDDPLLYLENKISRTVPEKVALNILGTGGSVKLNKKVADKISWIDQVNFLEKIIINYIDESSYYIIFDELDDDYKDVFDLPNYKQYMALLTSLFKASQDIKAIFRTTSQSIYPIVFIRDDIFEQIQDSDKTKWSDFSLELEWDELRIKNMLAFRLSRAKNPGGSISSFENSWHPIFSAETIELGQSDHINKEVFDYICQYTFYRPRDFIQYLKICCALARRRKEMRISHEVVSVATDSFSKHLRDELIDEIHGILPEINEIFNIISTLKKSVFSSYKFIHEYNRKADSGKIKKRDVSVVLNLLYSFNVIGNYSKDGTRVFSYTNKGSFLNINESICIHVGLWKSLNIENNIYDTL